MRASIPRLIAPLAVAVLVMLAGAAAALACSCAAATEAEQAAQASAVFAGTAAAASDPSPGDPSSSSDPITWTFAVDTVAKGSVAADQGVTTARDSASCGIDFEVGRRYLVFAHADGDGLATGLCSGTRPLARDEAVPDLRGAGLSLARALAFDRFPAYWLDHSFAGRGLTRIGYEPGHLSVTYGPLRFATTRKCAPRGAPPPTGIRRLRGVPAGFRAGSLVLFTGREEIRISGEPRLFGRAVAALTPLRSSLQPLPAGADLPRPAVGVMTMVDCAAAPAAG